MVDYHVDRPEVEALQDVELTGTNRSEILITLRTALGALEVLLCTAFESFPARSARAQARHRGGDQKLKGFWRPWRRGPTRSHPEHGS